MNNSLNAIKNLIKNNGFNKFIMVADAETFMHEKKENKIIQKLSAGGVSIALEPVIKTTGGVYIGRGKTQADREVLDKKGKIIIESRRGNYELKRIFPTDTEVDQYYFGFSNQTLWPLCHVAFEHPIFNKEWFDGYKKVNQQFAEAVKQEIGAKTFIWINDYQLSLVPKYLNRPKNTVVAMFWHIPWPTWEVFRILPYKKIILESLLSCDFLAFHRGYHVRNFIETIKREFEVRIDEETNKIYFGNHVIMVKNLPMGIDSDVISSLIDEDKQKSFLTRVIDSFFNSKNNSVENNLDSFIKNNKIIIGVDRLDYTKGLIVRLWALDKFFTKNPNYIGKVTYISILAPSRDNIPAYKEYKDRVEELVKTINLKYAKNNWQPIHFIYKVFTRKDLVNFYKNADLCLVTPLDDGMNLVSKEFVIASSFAINPGVLVLSQFAGSAIDLTRALIVNPYDIDQVADAIKLGLEMDKKEKILRIKSMAETLRIRNVYEWAEEFISNSINSSRDN